MGTLLIDNLDYRGRRFLDARQSVDTLAELKDIPEQTIPDGINVYCSEDGNWYDYRASNSVDPVTGKFRLVITKVAQETGERTDIPMSQKATTDVINDIDERLSTEKFNADRMNFIGNTGRINLFNAFESISGWLNYNADPTSPDSNLTEDSSKRTTNYLPINIKQATKYSYRTFLESFYGPQTAVKFEYYDKDRNFISRGQGVMDPDTKVISFVTDPASLSPAIKYIRFSYSAAKEDDVMYVEGDYPTEPIRYPLSRQITVDYSQIENKPDSFVECLQESGDSTEYPMSQKAITEFVENNRFGIAQMDFIGGTERVNLFNPNESVSGYLNYSNSPTVTNGNIVADGSKRTTNYLPVNVKVATKYSYKTFLESFYGPSNVIKFEYYDENKNFVSRGSGALDTVTGVISFTTNPASVNPSVRYIRFSYSAAKEDDVMFVEGDYPEEPIRYPLSRQITVDYSQIRNRPELANVLEGKKILWLGDSIGEGLTAGDGKYGWSGRIAETNKGTYYSLARSGATIAKGLVTSEGNAVVSVLTKLEELISGNHTGDYLIFEGGTNDADRIGNILGETRPEKFGSYTEDDFSGDYDADTFCGAFETIIYKALNQYKDRKIGYIVAPKMGTSINSLRNRRAYFDVAVEICRKWGVPHIDLWDGCWLNPKLPCHYDSTKDAAGNIEAGNYYVDGQHLTAKAYDYLAGILSVWLRTL